MLRQACDIEAIPDDAVDPEERTTIIAGLACSDVLPFSIIDATSEREPYGLATIQSDWRVFAAYSALVLEGHHLITGGNDYKIYKVNPLPNGDSPAVLEIIMRK